MLGIASIRQQSLRDIIVYMYNNETKQMLEGGEILFELAGEL